MSVMSELHLELMECSEQLINYVLYSEEAIQRIRNLHHESFRDVRGVPVCSECRHYLPCPTIKALDGEQG